MASSGLLQEYSGTLVLPSEGATVKIPDEPLKKYASFRAYIADVDPFIKAFAGFDLKQCFVANNPQGHNTFALRIIYARPPEVVDGKIETRYPPQAVSGKILWKVTGE
jgi:hypothetical protein